MLVILRAEYSAAHSSCQQTLHQLGCGRRTAQQQIAQCTDMQKLHAQHLTGEASVITHLTASQIQADVEHERWLHMSSATSCSTGKKNLARKPRLWSKESPVNHIANPRTETPGTFPNTTFHHICDSDCQCPVWDTKTRLSKEKHHFSETRNTESWGPV